MVGTLYHETFHCCHPSPVRWLANTQPSWVDAINGHSHNTLNFACQPKKYSTRLGFLIQLFGGAGLEILEYVGMWVGLCTFTYISHHNLYIRSVVSNILNMFQPDWDDNSK